MKGARGHARPGNAANGAKAEVFELALARVSARLEVVARAAAEELKNERLAAAAVRSSTGPGTTKGAGGADGSAKASTRRRATKTTGGLKRDASTKSKGKSRQAKKDAR